MNLRAGESIHLKPGFRAQVGSYLHAKINACPREFGKTSGPPQRGSRAKTVQSHESTALQAHVAPNPVIDALTVFINSSATGNGTIRILDARGAVVSVVQTSVDSGSGERTHVIGLDGLPSGIYYCIVQVNGSVVSVPFMRLP